MIIFPFNKSILQLQLIYNKSQALKTMAKKKSTQSTKPLQIPQKKTRSMILKQSIKQRQKLKKNNQQQLSNDIEDQNINDDNSSNQQNHQQFDQDYSSDSSNSDSQSSDHHTPIKPQNYAIKQMTFRQCRGTKMKTLMDRKKQLQQDSFWAQHKGYFGDLNISDDEDQQDYVQSSSGQDQFDSDFGDTQSQHDDQPESKKLEEQPDEQKQKEKKKRLELLKKINTSKQKQQKPRTQNKQQKNESKTKKNKLEPKIQQIGNRYIHQIFTQQQLLGQAAHTQYYNWLSLKKLISIQTQKKDFTKKLKHLDGQKIVYRDRLNQFGCRQITYELSGVEIHSIADLTSYWQCK